MVSVDTSEYDRFGPWVEEVVDERDVPRLFADHPLDLGAARLVLKVPRNIARRDATPRMHLYDQLLALEADRLTVLRRRVGPADESLGGYDVLTCRYADVVAVLDEVTLLEGRLRVLTVDGTAVTVDFNGAAHEPPRRLAEQLRSLAVASGRRAARRWRTVADPPALEQSTLGEDDIGVVNAYRAVLAQCPDLRLLGWHRRQSLRPAAAGAGGAVTRLGHALKPAVLHAAVLAADDETVELFGRRSDPVRGRMGEYALSRWVLIGHALDRVESAPHPLYPAARTVTFRAGSARLGTVLPADSPVHRVLTGRG